jgi:hypothetical protein
VSNTRDFFAPAAEKAATVRSIYTMILAEDATVGTNPAKGPTCKWFAIQNKDGSKSLYLQSDNDATVENDNTEIAPGVYKQWPWGDTKYDLRDEFIRVSADDPVFSIEIMWG